MFVLTIAVWLFSANASAISQHQETIDWQTWPKHEYQNSQSVLQILAVRRLLSKFEENPRIHIEIRYPGGVTGRQWGESFFNWLVSFGIPSKYIDLAPGSGWADKLTILVLDKRRKNTTDNAS